MNPSMKRAVHHSFLALLIALGWFSLTVHPAAAASDLAPGAAKGTFTPKGKPAVTLTNAAAFVDAKDDRRPVILILSDKKLPTEKWTSEFDLLRSHPNFSGVLFWLDKEGSVFRCDIYDKGKQSSVSGYFSLKLDGPMGKDLTGTAQTKDADELGPKLDAAFHVTLK
jgi:hypothetical protein